MGIEAIVELLEKRLADKSRDVIITLLAGSPYTTVLSTNSNSPIPGPAIPAYLDPANASPKIPYALPTSHVLRRPPKNLGQMSVAGVRQTDFEFDPPPNDFVRRKQLPPRVWIAGILCQIFAVWIIILVLYADHLARVQQLIGPCLAKTCQLGGVRQRDVCQIVTLVPFLPTTIVSFEVQDVAFGHHTGRIVTDVDSSGYIRVVTPAVQHLFSVNINLKETLAVPTAHPVAVRVLDDEIVHAVGQARLVDRVLVHAIGSRGSGEYRRTVGTHELVRRVLGELVGAYLDGHLGVATVAPI